MSDMMLLQWIAILLIPHSEDCGVHRLKARAHKKCFGVKMAGEIKSVKGHIFIPI